MTSKVRKLSIYLCLSAFIFLCSGADSLLVIGNVTDDGTGSPIQGALVVVAATRSGGPDSAQILDSVLTDSQGTYRINTIYPDGQTLGRVSIIATASLYQIGIEMATIRNPDDGMIDVIQEDFALLPATNPDTIIVTGTVVDDSGNAVEGASATIVAMGGIGAEVDRQTDLTDTSGDFKMTLIGQPINYVTWEVSKSGYTPAQGLRQGTGRDTVKLGTIILTQIFSSIIPSDVSKISDEPVRIFVYSLSGRLIACFKGNANEQSLFSAAVVKQVGAQPLILRWKQNDKLAVRKVIRIR